jgi:hypothetical protein
LLTTPNAQLIDYGSIKFTVTLAMNMPGSSQLIVGDLVNNLDEPTWGKGLVMRVLSLAPNPFVFNNEKRFGWMEGQAVKVTFQNGITRLFFTADAQIKIASVIDPRRK